MFPTGVGTIYKSELSVLKEDVSRAAETDSVLVYYSHNIGSWDKICEFDMRTDWLEELLAYANKLHLRIVGFDELNPSKNGK